MEYVYAAMLLHSAGQEISDDNVEKVLKAASVDVDKARVKALTASLSGVNIEDALSKAAIAAPAAAPVATAPAEEKKEEKKEEEEEEAVSEEEAAAGLGALFG